MTTRSASFVLCVVLASMAVYGCGSEGGSGTTDSDADVTASDVIASDEIDGDTGAEDSNTDGDGVVCNPLTCADQKLCGTYDDGCNGSITCTEGCACASTTWAQDCPDRPCESVTGCLEGTCVYEPTVCGGQDCTCYAGGCDDKALRSCGDAACTEHYCAPRPYFDGGVQRYENVCLDDLGTMACGTCDLGSWTCDEQSGTMICDDIDLGAVEAEFLECDSTLPWSTFIYLDTEAIVEAPDGSRDYPFMDFAAAQEAVRARNARGVIIAGAPTFDFTLEIVDGVSIYGGYAGVGGFEGRGAWQRTPSLRPTWFVSEEPIDGMILGVVAADITLRTLLANVDVRTGLPAEGASSGYSSVAVKAVRSPGLKLSHVHAEAANAGHGADGTTGVPGQDGGSGQSYPSSSHYTGGAPGLSCGEETPMDCDGHACGQGGRGEGYADTHTAGIPGNAGACGGAKPYGDGCPGDHGEPGTSGEGGAVGSFHASGLWLVEQGGNGVDGTPGDSGGGGGGGTRMVYSGGAITGAGGGGGGGGACGGQGGSGGFAGGVSVGLLVVDSTGLIVESSHFIAGDGGDGGDGGEGSSGGWGGGGGRGKETANLGLVSPRSGHGGSGGSGGGGGGGGGGSAGSSFGAYCLGSSLVLDGAVFERGVGGVAGQGGYPSTSNGASGDNGCQRNCLENCGDGILDDGEECDTQDGCAPDCTWLCSKDAHCDDRNPCNGQETCSLSTHQCEPGTNVDGSICDFDGTKQGECAAGICDLPNCGNDEIDDGEECDDGNRIDDDGCQSDCTLVCGAGVVGDIAPYRAVHDPLTGRCIVSFYWGLAQAEAEAHCQERSGHLLSISNAAENDAAVIAGAALGDCWIGYSDSAEEGLFEWSSHEGRRFEAWDIGEPSNSGGSEDCTVLAGAGVWNDMPCDSIYCFICELP